MATELIDVLVMDHLGIRQIRARRVSATRVEVVQDQRVLLVDAPAAHELSIAERAEEKRDRLRRQLEGEGSGE